MPFRALLWNGSAHVARDAEDWRTLPAKRMCADTRANANAGRDPAIAEDPLFATGGCLAHRAGSRAARVRYAASRLSCSRSAIAVGAGSMGSSSRANGLAAMRARISRMWRAFSNRCV